MDELLPDLAYLCGPAAAGRLSGTDGARQAAQYLARALKEAGLRPAGTNGYEQPLAVPAARLTGPVQLGTAHFQLRHRVDFAEMAHLSAGGRVAGPLAVVRDGDAVGADQMAGRIVLIPERPDGFDLAATASAAADLGAHALLVEHGEPRWFHKTVFASGSRIPVLRLRRSVAESLAGRAGDMVSVHLPLAAESLTCANVLGLLPGWPGRQTVLLAAHYDHVGDDPGGQRFPGAEDNASGVAVALAVARQLAARKEPLPFNLLVAFLTGEESGLWGARHLAAHPPFPLAAVVNLDGFGCEPTLAAVRLGQAPPGDWLAQLAAAALNMRGIRAQWVTGSDDSAAFLAAGLPAVGLGQQPTGPRSALPHTPDDAVESLHLTALAVAATAVTDIVTRLAERLSQLTLIS